MMGCCYEKRLEFVKQWQADILKVATGKDFRLFECDLCCELFW